MRTPSEQANFDLVCRLIDRVGERVARDGVESLTEPEITFLSVWRLEADVLNGGFDQYFFNDSGNWAGIVADALRRVGAERAAQIVSRAIALFPPPGPSPDRETRCRQLKALPDAQQKVLGDLTNEFFADPDPLEVLLAAYGRLHEPAFGGARPRTE